MTQKPPQGMTIASTSSKGGRGSTSAALVTGKAGPSQEALARHDEMMPVWMQQLHPDDGTDYTRIPSSYLRELYPYVYYWGAKANILLANLHKMNEMRLQELLILDATPGYNQFLQAGSFTEDLLVTYGNTKLAQLLLREDVLQLMPYIKALHEAQLFQIAYRNVSTAEVHEENVVRGLAQDTPLHTYYSLEMRMYIPKAWEEEYHVGGTGRQVDLIQSIFIRICLGEPIMEQVPEVAGDWAVHVAFCERWGLTP